MALKVLQVVATVAIVLLVALMIPIMIRMRRAAKELGVLVSDAHPQTMVLLKKANATLDGVNRELESVEEVTEDAQVLVERVGDASQAVEQAIKSPLTKTGIVVAGATVAALGVKRSLNRKLAGKS